jgi:hypothetical protein
MALNIAGKALDILDAKDSLEEKLTEGVEGLLNESI